MLPAILAVLVEARRLGMTPTALSTNKLAHGGPSLWTQKWQSCCPSSHLWCGVLTWSPLPSRPRHRCMPQWWTEPKQYTVTLPKVENTDKGNSSPKPVILSTCLYEFIQSSQRPYETDCYESHFTEEETEAQIQPCSVLDHFHTVESSGNTGSDVGGEYLMTWAW